jgi:starvation-inducible DNA-binding protein
MPMIAPDLTKPYATLNSLPGPARAQVALLLNRRLADAIDLQGQCKQAHWNVKGPQFIALHQLFDEVYEAVGGYVDLIAERIVQLGGIAEGTVRIAAERSELDEYPVEMWAGMDHVKSLSTALGAFGSRIRFAIQETDELEDAGSADLCTEVSRGVEKWLWFVEAHLQTH